MTVRNDVSKKALIAAGVAFLMALTVEQETCDVTITVKRLCRASNLSAPQKLDTLAI